MKSKYTRIIIEIIAWTFFLGFPFILFPTFEPYLPKGVFRPAFNGIILTHTLLICFYYLNFYVLLPRFFFKRKFNIYFPLVLGCLLFIVVLMHIDPNFNPITASGFRWATGIFIATIVIRFIMVFLLSLGFAHIARLQRSEKEKLSTELSFLKAQINPHFLFNTLNSIYALSVKKSDHTPESITKLSAIMRYIITDAAADTVSLQKEMNYVSSYIELEKLRLTSKVKLNFMVTGEMNGQQIAPLIFIPLVENAFKHGVSTSEESEINILINFNAGKLDLQINNSKVRADNNNSNGLGIENTKRRLDLLYPGKHILSIKDNEKRFSANLVLVL